jgi:hypothetical protein
MCQHEERLVWIRWSLSATSEKQFSVFSFQFSVFSSLVSVLLLWFVEILRFAQDEPGSRDARGENACSHDEERGLGLFLFEEAAESVYGVGGILALS